jgi:methylmalonyl-CoA mutase N-terminal domain/subunit
MARAKGLFMFALAFFAASGGNQLLELYRFRGMTVFWATTVGMACGIALREWR